MTLPYDGPRESGPRCRGCGEFFTMDEVQAGGHTCRVSSNNLTPMQIAHAQAGCLGRGWEVTPDGLGFVLFDDPAEAWAVLHSAPGHTDLMVSPESITAMDLPDTTPEAP